MPQYVYECGRCDSRTEHRRAVDERDHPFSCPSCGSPCLRDRYPGIAAKLASTHSNAAARNGASTFRISNNVFNGGEGGVLAPDSVNLEMKGNKFRETKRPVVRYRKKK